MEEQLPYKVHNKGKDSLTRFEVHCRWLQANKLQAIQMAMFREMDVLILDLKN